MTAIVARDARASLLLDVVARTADSIQRQTGDAAKRPAASVPSDRRVSARDYSLFDQIDHGRAASQYSRSRGAKRADLCRKALYLLAIACF